MTDCSAPWYELNLSAPDGNVSACCYYAGARDEWLDGPVDIERYWNSPGIREVRLVQGGHKPAPNGCSSCFFFQQTLPGQTYYDFVQQPNDLSEAQIANWQLAKSEYEAKTEVVSCRPLRLYANFGYACNLSCTMCHQVPRRGELKRQILADSILSWHEALERCLEVCVIGGEPFTLPEAVKFIRKFSPDQRYETVRLWIGTNGTVLHKHWRTLEKKRLLTLAVSIDSIGQGYEAIRVGGTWADVERNLLTALELQARSHPNWIISTTANMQKAGIPYLPELAAWHVKHGVPTFFYDFISASGVEDTYHTDNLLQNPQLLDSIPRWRDFIDEASQIFRSAGRTVEAAQLEQYRDRVTANANAKADHIAKMRRQRNRNDWRSLVTRDGKRNWESDLASVGAAGKSPVPVVKVGELTGFSKTRLGDHFATAFRWIVVPAEGGKFRVRAHWPKGVPADPYTRLAHIVVQDQNYTELGDFREYQDFGFGTELVMTGDIAPDVLAIRVRLTPLGEDVTLLPDILELDIDSDTGLLGGTGDAPMPAQHNAPNWLMRNIKRLVGRY